MRHDLLADVMVSLNNADTFGKQECVIRASNVVKDVLKILQEEDYIGNFEYIDDHKSGKFKIEMKGKINKSRAIKPKFSVKANNMEKWEIRFLPSRELGILILTTSSGVMTQKKAKENKVGGKLLAYVY
jgi:small subunit ribosomal protein S8